MTCGVKDTHNTWEAGKKLEKPPIIVFSVTFTTVRLCTPTLFWAGLHWFYSKPVLIQILYIQSLSTSNPGRPALPMSSFTSKIVLLLRVKNKNDRTNNNDTTTTVRKVSTVVPFVQLSHRCSHKVFLQERRLLKVAENSNSLHTACLHIRDIFFLSCRTRWFHLCMSCVIEVHLTAGLLRTPLPKCLTASTCIHTMYVFINLESERNEFSNRKYT